MRARTVRRPSFANRLLGWFVLFITLSAGVNVGVLRTTLNADIQQRVDAAFEQEVGELRDISQGVDPQTGQPFGTDVRGIFEFYLSTNVPGANETVVTLLDGQVHARSRVEPPARLDLDAAFVATVGAAVIPTRGTTTSAAGAVEYVAMPLDGEDPAGVPVRGTFVVAEFVDLARGEADQTVLLVGLIQAGIVLLSALGVAVWVSRRLSRPLASMASVAEGLGSSDLTTRVAVPDDRELGILGSTLNQMLDRLQATLTAQREFLADVGHELRTPITIVSGHLDVLDDDAAARQETVDMLQDELERMARMVADLSTLARAQQPDFVTPAPTEIDSLVQRLDRTVVAIADRRWRVSATDAVAGTRQVLDTDRIIQAVVALCDNAARHTEPDGQVQVHVDGTDTAVVIVVDDDGPGVPAELADTVFERFRRGGSQPGSGLGLSIVAAIAAAHGGAVTVGGSPLGGARFSIEIPTAGPRRPAGEDHPGRSLPTAASAPDGAAPDRSTPDRSAPGPSAPDGVDLDPDGLGVDHLTSDGGR